MSIAKEYIEEYKEEYRLDRVEDTCHLKHWFEEKLQKSMNGALFVSMGRGGGQTYKTLWEVFDSIHNNNKQSVYFNENKKACKILNKNGHISLDNWIKG